MHHGKTRLFGILNVTPDSFSDGALYANVDAALERIAALIEDGADIIDIGAESTRPGAQPLSQEEEWQRLEPVLQGLSRFRGAGVEFSIDTRYAATAKAALHYGVEWINDVSGFADPLMQEAVKESDCKLVVMHSLSVPADRNVVLPEEVNVIDELLAFAMRRIDRLTAAGIARARIVFDPGIGFGKTPAQSLAILRGIGCFATLGVPLLVGHSRKSFLAHATASPMERDDATLVVSQTLAGRGVDYLRVHDVRCHRGMLDMMEALSHG